MRRKEKTIMAHEFNESFNAPAECSQNMCSLGDYAMVRQSTQPAQFDRQSNSNLEDAGVLPKFELQMKKDGDKDVPEIKNPFKDIATKDMKDAGIKATEVDDHGKKVTTVETKSGARVTVIEGAGKEITKPDGTKVKQDFVVVDPNGPLHAKDKSEEVWVDSKGREIVRKNKDGSATIDSGEGVFVRQDSHGVKKVSAIRDGKSFQEFDPSTPLGDMRPPQIPVRK